MQFCSADPVARYVPWSEASLSPCGHDGHRFCELFLAVAGGVGRGPAGRETPTGAPEGQAGSLHSEQDGVALDGAEVEGRISTIDDLPLPGWLLYSPNHLWLDMGDDGLCHLGIDAFLARVLGSVERLVFLTRRGEARPTVVLTARGVDLTLTFPWPMPIAATNNRLRSSLERLTSDPYGSGWLFACRQETAPLHGAAETARQGLLAGQAALTWMTAEVGRLTEFVHQQILGRRPEGELLLADGGVPVPDLIAHLGHEEIVRLFGAFFPPPSSPSRLS